MWQYMKKYKGLIILNFFCVFGFVLIELGLPTLLAIIIDQGVLVNDFEKVKEVGIWMVTICVVALIALILLAFCVSKITTYIARDIRNDVFLAIQKFSHKEYDKFGVSSLLTRTTNDVYQIMQFLQMMLKLGMITPLMFISSFIMIIITSPSLAWTILIAIPFLIVGIVLIGTKSSPISKRQQKVLDGVNRISRENLMGLRVVRAFNNESFQEERFTKVNEKYAGESKRLFKLMGFAQPSFFLILDVVIVLLIWFGATQINMGHLEIGTLVAFIDYVFHALFSLTLFATVFMMYPRAAVSANRIKKVLKVQPVIHKNKKGFKDETPKGVVEFKNVTFSYSNKTEKAVLKNISFKASPGETVAFIGSTGSGKSTLIQLVPRFYDVTDGAVLIDGVDVREYELDDLRKHMSFAPQKSTLFTGTIEYNLKFGNEDATEEAMDKAIEIAQAKDFVEHKVGGIKSMLSEGGSNLSGGQKQRLAIARAIVKNAPIYIFDDSFSALDFKTDSEVRKSLKEVTAQSTVLIVAQRVASIMDADKIIVLNEGNIVAEGSHQELLRKSKIYHKIASSQLSEEELA